MTPQEHASLAQDDLVVILNGRYQGKICRVVQVSTEFIEGKSVSKVQVEIAPPAKAEDRFGPCIMLLSDQVQVARAQTKGNSRPEAELEPESEPEPQPEAEPESPPTPAFKRPRRGRPHREESPAS